MKTIKFIASLFVLAVLSSCGSSRELYSWQDYEKTSYDFSKDASEKHEAKLLETYSKMIDHPGGVRKQVPPGICAELGYIYFKKNQPEKAKMFFEKEVEIYPESALFINRIIESLGK